MNWPIFHDLHYKHSGTFANRKYEAILITLLKMRPQSSRGTSPLAFYKQVPLPPPGHNPLDFSFSLSLLPSSFNSLIVPVFTFFYFGKADSRRRSGINTGRFSNWAPKALLRGFGGRLPQEIVWILTPLSPLSWPISVKRWKPVWIHGCLGSQD